MQAAGAVMRLLQRKRASDPEPKVLSRDEVLTWLREDEEWKLDFLWEEADRVRKEHVGDAVHLRGLIELSSYCRRDCHYCGIRASRRIERYRMTEEEVMECVASAVRLEYGTVVLQSGEDLGLGRDFITALVRRIKQETPLAITLALGERGLDELEEWRRAGADRYLLKHETSDPALFRRIHPDCAGEVSDRVALLRAVRAMGYEAGSGVMVGIPGQTFESLANDILLFRELDLEMIGCGPFVAHPETPLGRIASESNDQAPNPNTQVPGTDVMTTKVVALTRLSCPDANIPSTTALATVNKEHGRELGLQRGANVWMPNLTQLRYRSLYEIYPGKAKAPDTAEEFQKRLLATLAAIGRTPGKGPGSRNRQLR
jgi:biotin synthase